MKRSLSVSWRENVREGKRTVKSPRGYYHAEATVSINRDCNATVDVEIDLEKILEIVARGAGSNKSGKCRFLNGLVRAKRIGGKRVLFEERVEIPLDEGYTLVEKQ
jgi:hypothetical protein